MIYQHLRSTPQPLIGLVAKPFLHVGLAVPGTEFILPIRGTIEPVKTFTAKSGENVIYTGTDLNALAEAASGFAGHTASEHAKAHILATYGEKKSRTMRDRIASIMSSFGYSSDVEEPEPLVVQAVTSPFPTGKFELTPSNVGAKWVLEPGEDATDDLLLFLELLDSHADIILEGSAEVLLMATTRCPYTGENIMCAIVRFKKGQRIDAHSKRTGENTRLEWDGTEVTPTVFGGKQFSIFKAVYESGARTSIEVAR